MLFYSADFEVFYGNVHALVFMSIWVMIYHMNHYMHNNLNEIWKLNMICSVLCLNKNMLFIEWE